MLALLQLFQNWDSLIRVNTKTWLDELIGSDSMRTAATKSGLAISTLSRQQEHLPPEMVIALCRAYGRSPVTGLIETGYLQKWETEGVSIPYALEQATNEELLDEIMRRSDPEARYLFGGGDGVVDLDPNALPLRVVADSSPDEGEGLPDDYEP